MARSVEVDPGLCQGHGRCLDNAPDVFAWDEEKHQASVAPDADLGSGWEDILLAADACPEQAIKVR
jgi:ferredoxin